jgi:DNA-binding transcriptional MerR regulator
MIHGRMQDPHFLTTTDAARMIGVASETVRQWENIGKLQAFRTASGVRLFARADVERVAREYREDTEVRSTRR